MKRGDKGIGTGQRIAIAALLALGVAGAVAILGIERQASVDPHGHAAAPAGAGHADEHGHAQAAAAPDAHDHAHAGEEDHAHAGEADHAHAGEAEHSHAGEAAHSHAGEAGPAHAGEAAHSHAGATGPAGTAARAGEGKVPLTDTQAKAAGIAVEAAAPAVIRTSLKLPGEIRFNEDRTAHVVPRVSGVVEGVAANLGQQVRRGQVLAVISSPAVSEQRSELQAAQRRLALARTTHAREQSLWQQKISPEQDVLAAEQALREAEIAVANASQKLQAIGAGPGDGRLNRYELRAPFDGTVVEKHVALGEAVKEDTSVFTISDLSAVWAEVDVAARDLNRVRVGERVTVRSSAFEETAAGTVAYVGSLLGEQTRTAKARITVANPNGAWRPGLFVTAELVTGEAPAPVTVSTEAIQRVDDRTVVFLKVPGGFVARPVELGRSDGRRVEVVAGLAAGAPHAAAGSFMVKAQAGKATATHTH